MRRKRTIFGCSNGNRVNVGNFDAKGLNVNDNWDDNQWNNLGVAASRNFSLYQALFQTSA